MKGIRKFAIAKLDMALKDKRIFTKALSDDLVNFASSLQEITRYSDEEIIDTQKSLINFGLDGNQLKETTKLVLDMAGESQQLSTTFSDTTTGFHWSMSSIRRN